MKARVKATGEIITITGTDGICLTDENGYYHLIRDLEGCEAMFDYWEKLKHQYAGMVMQGMFANPEFKDVDIEFVVLGAVGAATELIKKLKEEEK